MLSEGSQTKQVTYCKISFISSIENRDKDWCLAWVGQREGWGAVALIDTGFYFGEM